MGKNKILLFIPMYNCEKQITRVLSQLTEEVQNFILEVIIVNNRSTDNGEEAVFKFLKSNKFDIPVSLLRNDENYGLGGSHKVAFNYAIDNGFDYVIVLHGDDQGHIDDLIPYFKNKEYEKYDAFLGGRFVKGSKLRGYSLFRTFGNIVYNIIFSIFLRKKIYDLGSGLNVFKVETLKSKYYMKFKDNLVFNYCLVMAFSYYKMKIKFFPILWSEDDQVSNVKMMSQATMVLRLLFSYIRNKSKFMHDEHRDRIFDKYSYVLIYKNEK